MGCNRNPPWDSAGLSCKCRETSRKIAKLPPTWGLYPQVIKDRKTWTVRTRQKIRMRIFSVKKMTISKLQQFQISPQHRLVHLRAQGKQGLISANHKKTKRFLNITTRISIETDRCPREELLIFWQTKSTMKIKRDLLASRWSKCLHLMTVQPLSINNLQMFYLLLVSRDRMRSKFNTPQTQMTNLKKKKKKSQWIKSLQSSPKLIEQD